MSKSPKSLSRKQKIWGSLCLGILIVALLWLPVNHLAKNQAQKAMAKGDAQQDRSQALVWYQVADRLDSKNADIDMKLSLAYLEQGNAKAALTSAQQAIDHGAGASGYILKSKAMLELDNRGGAEAAAEAAVRATTNYKQARLQLGITYAAVGNSSKLSELISLLGSQEPVKTLKDLQHNQFTLAQTLYDMELLKSSQRVLDSHQEEQSDYYLLKAMIAMRLASNHRQGLEQGRDLLVKAVAISPERIDVRRQLKSVYEALGDTAAAGEQGIRIRALEEGKV